MTRPSIALMFVTDGRLECAERTLRSLSEIHPPGTFQHTIVVDDGCSRDYSKWLDEWRWDVHLPPGKTKRGFDGAIRSGWQAVLASKCDFVFHLEDDYVSNRFWSLEHMVELLDEYQDLVQVALKRQPWGGDAGEPHGFVGLDPDSYVDHTTDSSIRWFSHEKFFTTNPSLYRVSLCERGWPVGEFSEGRFHHELKADEPTAFYGYLGHKFDEPWVTHIGLERAGVRY